MRHYLSKRLPHLTSIAVLCSLALALSASTSAPAAPGHVYWSTIGEQSLGSQSSKIKRAQLDGSGVETLFSNPSTGRFGGIALDAANDHLYTGHGGALIRAHLNGTDAQILVGGTSVTDVELDLLHGKIYWSDTTRDLIMRCNLNGSGVEAFIVLTYSELVEGLAINPNAAKIYYAYNASGANPRIRMANLDGSGNSIFQQFSGIAFPFDVESDPTGGELFWNIPNIQQIQESLMDGSGEVQVAATLPSYNGNGFAYDPVAQRFYFGARLVYSYGAPLDLYQISINGTDPELVVQEPGGINYIEVLNLADGNAPETTCPISLTASCGINRMEPVNFSVTAHDDSDPSPVVDWLAVTVCVPMMLGAPCAVAVEL